MHFTKCTWCKILLNKFHKNAYLFFKMNLFIKKPINFLKECAPNDVLLINEDVKSMTKISHYAAHDSVETLRISLRIEILGSATNLVLVCIQDL